MGLGWGAAKPQTRAVFELSLGLRRQTTGSRLQDQGCPGMKTGENLWETGTSGTVGAGGGQVGGATGQLQPGEVEV